MTPLPTYRAWDLSQKKMHPVKAITFDYCEDTGIKADEVGVQYGEPYCGDALEALDGHHGEAYLDGDGEEAPTPDDAEYEDYIERLVHPTWNVHRELDDGKPSPNATCVLMRSTGLTDKNGKEIFEGDVVSGVEHDGVILSKCEVVFRDGCFCLGREGWPMILLNMTLEVIGNIYENPELLPAT